MTDGRPPSLGAYLALGLALRLPAVLFAHGYEFVDQQLQYVDPAWHLASGHAWLPTWEWQAGMRSWVYPGLLAGMLWLPERLGVHDPLARMAAVRGLHALISLAPLAAFWLLVVRWRPLPDPRHALLLVAASGPVVFAGVQPSGPTFAAGLAAAAVIAFLGPGRAPPLVAGLLLGTAFCARLQDAALGPVLVAAGLLTRRFAAAGLLVLGCLPPVLVQGAVDLHTWGTFLSSPFANLHHNLVLGAANSWHTEPWWYYIATVALPMTLALPLLLRPAGAMVARAWRHGPLLVVAAASHLVVHSCIARKSVRFLMTTVVLATAAAAIGLALGTAPTRAARWHRRLLVGVHLALLVFLSLCFFHRGPVLAACALRAEPRFDGELVVVDGPVTAVGGAYYLDRAHLAVTPVARADLASWLRSAPPRATRFLLAVRAPLAAADVGDAGTLHPVGTFTAPLDFRARDRRFVYRLEAPRR